MPAVTALFAVVAAVVATLGAVHPQDGPHADIRIAIERDVVRCSLGMNLAFLDEVAPAPRELLDALDDREIPDLREAFERFLAEHNRVVIDGIEVAPIVASFDVFADPEPARLVLFPKTGMRGLIRAIAIIEYPAKQPPSEVAITWGGYPPDPLAPEAEAGLEAPPMFLEAQLRADGALTIVRFSEAQPTCTWRSAEAGGTRVLADVPVPPSGTPAQTVPVVSALGGAAALLAVIHVLVRLGRGRGLAPVGVTIAVLGVITAATMTTVARVPIPGTARTPPLPDDEGIAAVFGPLHANLYRAFDYTEESDIYDALARSVHGPLLEELYDAIYSSLVQSDQGGMLGIVTGVEPLKLEVLEIRAGEPGDEATVRFRVRHRWRVAGTVYHWGHSHTRRHQYEAEYDVGALPAGWRITGEVMLRQWRLDLLDEI